MSVPFRRERLEDLQRVADAMRDPIDTPDLTSSILSRVDSQRPFLPAPARRAVPVARIAAAAAVLLAGLTIILIQRASPENTSWSGRAAPMTTLIDTVAHSVQPGPEGPLNAIRRTFESAQNSTTIVFDVLSGAADDAANLRTRGSRISLAEYARSGDAIPPGVLDPRTRSVVASIRLGSKAAGSGAVGMAGSESEVWLDGRWATCPDCMFASGFLVRVADANRATPVVSDDGILPR